MYLLVIAWMYVVVMMSVAEATNSTGTLLGATITFVLYGLLPVALVVYLMGTPARRKALRLRENAEDAQQKAMAQAGHELADQPPASGKDAHDSIEPDAGSHPAGRTKAVAIDTGVAAVRKEP